MDFTIDQFKELAAKFPVVVRLDGVYVPVDVPMFIAALDISGVAARSFSLFRFEHSGAAIYVLSGIAWERIVTPRFFY